MSLKRAKTADGTFNKTVFGFIRQHEKSESMNVPTMIKYLILNYYLLEDMFEHHGKCMRLEDNNLTVCRHCEDNIHDEDYGDQNPSYHYAVAYGRTAVGDLEECIAEYEWTIQLKCDQNCFTVGLGKITQERNGYSFPLGMFGVLFFDGVDGIRWQGIVQGVPNRRNELLKSRHVNCVKIRMNMVNAELSFFVDEKLVVTFGEADGFKIGNFRLVAMLIAQGDSAKLSEFKIRQTSNISLIRII